MVIYVYKSFKEPFKLFEGREMLQHPPSRNEDSMSENNLLDIASFSPKSLQPPSAWLGHIAFAAWIIREVSPKIFVELGTHSGNSYFAFCQSVAEAQLSTQCYAVDTWQGDEHASYYGADVFAKVSAHHQEHYAGFSHLLRMTFDDAVTHFADESIDLLHIDGLHTYEAVRHDFETWLPKLAPGAVVMFHDTNVRERNFGVWKWWEELQKQYPNNIEFSHSYGLGVLQLNNAPDGKQLRWLQSGLPDKQRLIKYFSALGLREELKNEIAERDKQIATLYSSTSWRITRPLRLAARQMRHVRRIVELTKPAITRPLRMAAHQMTRVRRIVELTKPAIARGGGLKRTLNKAILIYRCEGLEGIRRRIRIVATLELISPVRRHALFTKDYNPAQIYDTYVDVMEPKDVDLERMKNVQATFWYRPKFSIVVPVYNVEERWLRRCIQSVQLQVYPEWELCIADDCSTMSYIRPLLAKYAASDPRIKVVFREKNGHISEATNSALDLTTGDFMCLMDNDDEIAPNALYEFADLLNKDAQIDMIYSDEDKIDTNNRRYDPFLKPDWSPESLEGCMYTAHFACYRMQIVDEIGHFRVGYEGAQDYEFVLRFTERATKIVHVPKVLYHWRAIPGSTAATMDAKNYVLDAAVRALTDRANRMSGGGQVKLGRFPGCFDTRYAVQGSPLVSIIIPSAGRLASLRGKLTDILVNAISTIYERNSYKHFEIVVVDNDDLRPETIEALSRYDCRFVHWHGEFNIAAKMNMGAKKARGQYLLFMNDDIEPISHDWMECMLQFAQRPGVGVVGAKLYFESGKLQHVGVAFCNGLPDHIARGMPGTDPGYFYSSCATRNYLAVTGAVMMTRRDVFEGVGGFDERLAVNYNDIDYCLNVFRSGRRVVFAAGAELYHYESVSRGRTVAQEEIVRFMERWGKFVANDPYFGPCFEDQPPMFVLRRDLGAVTIVDPLRSTALL